MAPITKLLRKVEVFEWIASVKPFRKIWKIGTFKLLYLSVLTKN
jgi:hypothetical protein